MSTISARPFKAPLLAAATCLSVLFGGWSLGVRADDWPQWLGPRRDAVWRETGIVQEFPKAGLKSKWRVPVELGYSGPAVSGGKVYVADFARQTGKLSNNPSSRTELGGMERLLCFDAATGDLLWKHETHCKYKLSYAGGPRVTPTVNDGKVYSLGAEGNFLCLDAKTGHEIWTKSLTQEFKTPTPFWGFCGHPLIEGESLFCIVGGKESVAVALNKRNGKEIWRALSAREPGYSAPTMIEAGGVKQLVIWHAEAINGLNPANGEVYWSVPLKPDFGMSIMAPRQSGEYLFASGVGQVGALLKLSSDKPGATVIWRGDAKSAVYAANTTPFIEDGVIYGVDCRPGIMRAVDLLTGKRLWESYRPTTAGRRATYATTFIVKHADRYFLFTEKGDLILAKMNRSGYHEISRTHVLEPTNETFGRPVVWSHPAFAEKCLFARNDKELVCVPLGE